MTHREDCAGGHECDFPEVHEVGLEWTCPECGLIAESFCMADETDRLNTTISSVLAYHGHNLALIYGWRGRYE
jgi:hypothetical protein